MQADSNNSFILGCVLTTTLYMYAILSYQFQLLGRLLHDSNTITCYAYKLISLDLLPLIEPPHKLQDLCFKFTLQTLAYLTLPAFSDSPDLPDENQMTVEGIEPSLVYPWYTCAPYTYCLRNHRPMCYHRLHSKTPCTLVAIVWLTFN